MKRTIRGVIGFTSLVVLALGAAVVDSYAPPGYCNTCVDTCFSGLVAACQEDCGENFVPDGCGINQMDCEGVKEVACVNWEM